VRNVIYKKAALGAALLLKAIAQPRLIAFALRVRGWRWILHVFMQSDAETIKSIFHDLQFHSLPPTAHNLSAHFSGIQAIIGHDQHLFEVIMASGERFLIRRSHAWSDLGVVHGTMVGNIYADHPAVEGQSVLDVGANIGDTAIYFAKRGAHVVAYEPDPELFELALRNVALNDATVDLRNAGVGGETGTLPLSTTRTGADAMSTTLFPGAKAVHRLHVRTIPVRIVALADVLAELESVCLLKIDCEGCEYPALLSLSVADLRKIEHIIMEYHGRRDELADVLRQAGFSVRLKGTMYMYADRVDGPEGTPAAYRD